MKDVIELSRHHLTLNLKHPLYTLLTEQARYTQVRSKGVVRKMRRLYNISNLTEDPEVMKNIIAFLADRYRAMGDNAPTHIVGVPTCGYILAAPLALALGIPFVPLTVGERSESSFITDGDEDDAPPLPPLTIRSGALDEKSRVVLVDDQILTGKTAVSALDCVLIAGAKVVEFAVVCDMALLRGIRLIHNDSSFREVPVLTLFRLQNSGDVMFPKKSPLSHL